MHKKLEVFYGIIRKECLPMKRKSLFAVLALALCLVLLLSGCSNPLKKKAPENNEPAVNIGVAYEGFFL